MISEEERRGGKPRKGGRDTESGKLNLLRQVAAGIAAQFGSDCEVVVHDLSRHPDHTIVAIEMATSPAGRLGTGRPMWSWSSWRPTTRSPGITSAI